MFLTVHLSPNEAAMMRASPKNVDIDLRKTLDDFGLVLEPLHPGAMDQELVTQYFAEVQDELAQEVCDRLLLHPCVLAAYAKPPGTAPFDL